MSNNTSRNRGSPRDGGARQYLDMGVCVMYGSCVPLALRTQVVNYFRQFAPRMRAHVVGVYIFIKCSPGETDFLMARRPHFLPGTQDKLFLRRILPRPTFDPTDTLELELRDPPVASSSLISQKLEVVLESIGKVSRVVGASNSADNCRYVVKFNDYDSVDVLALLLQSWQTVDGCESPFRVTPMKATRSWAPFDCIPSTTAFSHLTRVGPPNLTASALTAVSVVHRTVETSLPNIPPIPSAPTAQNHNDSLVYDATPGEQQEPALLVEKKPHLLSNCSASTGESTVLNSEDSREQSKRVKLLHEPVETEIEVVSYEQKATLLRNIYQPQISSPPIDDTRPSSRERATKPELLEQQADHKLGRSQVAITTCRWELLKFVGGELSESKIDLQTLGFPVTIGRDSAQAKIHVQGLSMQHVSRLHAKLCKPNSEGGFVDFLWVYCLSMNGLLVDGVPVVKGARAKVRNGSTIIFGDVSRLAGSSVPNRELRFLVRRIVEDLDGGCCPQSLSSESPRTISTNTIKCEESAIVISDSGDEQEYADLKPQSGAKNVLWHLSGQRDAIDEARQHGVIVLSDDDNDDECDEEVRDNKLGLNNRVEELVQNFKDEPVDESSPDDAQCYEFLTRPVEESSEPRSGNGRASIDKPDVVNAPVVADFASSSSSVMNVAPFSHGGVGAGAPTCNFFKLNVATPGRSAHRKKRTFSETSASARLTDIPVPSRPAAPASDRRSSQIRIGFDSFRRCLLDLSLPSEYRPQLCQQKFINYVKSSSGSPVSTDELTRLLFCCFCLEAYARVGLALERLKSRQQFVTQFAIQAALVSQRKVTKDVLRLRLIVACKNGASRPLDNTTVMLLHAMCVRLGGKQLRLRRFIGIVYSNERKDRRDRSGSVAVPETLARKEEQLDVVDEVLVDIDASTLEGLQLQADHVITVERLCEVHELKRVVLMREIPQRHCRLLLGSSHLTRVAGEGDDVGIWSPQDAVRALEAPSAGLQHAMRGVAHVSQISSEQSNVICAALAQISVDQMSKYTHGIAPVTAMLVEGAAGSGKSSVLQEIALQALLVKPQDSVLIFCKWPQAADQMALQMQDLIESRDYRNKICVTRVGQSRNRLVIPLTLSERIRQISSKECAAAVAKLKQSILEMEKRIDSLRQSLEDQINELTPALKRKKLLEIARSEETLSLDRANLTRIEGQIAKNENASGTASSRVRRILEESQILVCGYTDVETFLIGQPCERDRGKRMSLVLVDQSQEVTTADLVPLMQLPANRFVLFGDRAQSAYYRPKHLAVRASALLQHSAFERLGRAYSERIFHLRSQWRLPYPLDVIANAVFYNGRLRLSRKSNAKQLPNRQELAAFTMVDVCGSNLLPDRTISQASLDMICNVTEALAHRCRRLHVVSSFSNTTVPVTLLASAQSTECDAQIVGPELLTHLVEPEAVILPLFNAPFIDELARRDPPMLCSIVTRPSKTLVIIGCLSAAASRAPKIGELIQHAKRTNRYISEKPSWLTGVPSETLLHYLLQ